MQVAFLGPDDTEMIRDISEPFSTYAVVPGPEPDTYWHFKLSHRHTTQGLDEPVYRFDHLQERGAARTT